MKTGPWLRQHDVNLVEANRYSVFGNDVYARTGKKREELFGDSSQVYLFDPTTQAGEGGSRRGPQGIEARAP